MSTDEKLMTAKEVATFMRVEERTVRRWVQLGRLRPLRVGRTIRFSRSNLLQAMEASREESGPSSHDPAMG